MHNRDKNWKSQDYGMRMEEGMNVEGRRRPFLSEAQIAASVVSVPLQSKTGNLPTMEAFQESIKVTK